MSIFINVPSNPANAEGVILPGDVMDDIVNFMFWFASKHRDLDSSLMANGGKREISIVKFFQNMLKDENGKLLLSQLGDQYNEAVDRAFEAYVDTAPSMSVLIRQATVLHFLRNFVPDALSVVWREEREKKTVPVTALRGLNIPPQQAAAIQVKQENSAVNRLHDACVKYMERFTTGKQTVADTSGTAAAAILMGDEALAVIAQHLPVRQKSMIAKVISSTPGSAETLAILLLFLYPRAQEVVGSHSGSVPISGYNRSLMAAMPFVVARMISDM